MLLLFLGSTGYGLQCRFRCLGLFFLLGYRRCWPIRYELGLELLSSRALKKGAGKSQSSCGHRMKIRNCKEVQKKWKIEKLQWCFNEWRWYFLEVTLRGWFYKYMDSFSENYSSKVQELLQAHKTLIDKHTELKTDSRSRGTLIPWVILLW